MDVYHDNLDELKSAEQTIQISKDIKEKVYFLYEKYKITQEHEILKKLINTINDNMNYPNVREFLDLKIGNETIFDIMIKLKIDFSFKAMEYICSQEDLLVKVIKNDDYRILNSASEEDFFRNP